MKFSNLYFKCFFSEKMDKNKLFGSLFYEDSKHIQIIFTFVLPLLVFAQSTIRQSKRSNFANTQVLAKFD